MTDWERIYSLYLCKWGSPCETTNGMHWLDEILPSTEKDIPRFFLLWLLLVCFLFKFMSVLPVPFEFFTLSVSKKEIKSVGFFSLLRTDLQVYISWYYLNFTFIFYIFIDAYYDSDLYKNSNLTNVYCASLCYYLNQLIVYRKLLWPWQFIMLYIHLLVLPGLH